MFGIIKILLHALVGGAALAFPEIIKRLLIAFGIGAIVFTGLNASMDFLSNLALNSLLNINSPYVGIIGLLKIPNAFNLIISASTIKLTLKSMNAGSFKQLKLF